MKVGTSIDTQAVPQQFILTKKGLEDIKNAESRDKIGNTFSRVWDAIYDWFCGGSQTECKKDAYNLREDFILPGTTKGHNDVSAAFKADNDMCDGGKVKSFYSLQNAAGDVFKDRFTVTPNKVLGQRIPQSSTYTINLKGTSCQDICEKIEFTSPNYPVGMLNWVAENNQKDLRENALILYSKEATETEKIAAFNKLKEIVGKEYQVLFKTNDNDKGISYKLDLDGMTPEELNGYGSFSLKLTKLEIDKDRLQNCLFKALKSCDDEKLAQNLDKVEENFNRADYLISGNKHEGTFKEYKNALSNLSVNDNRLKTIMTLCNQVSISAIKEAVQKKNGGITISSSNNLRPHYDVFKGSDGDVYFKYRLQHDLYDDYGDDLQYSIDKSQVGLGRMYKYVDLNMTVRLDPLDKKGIEKSDITDVSALVKTNTKEELEAINSVDRDRIGSPFLQVKNAIIGWFRTDKQTEAMKDTHNLSDVFALSNEYEKDVPAEFNAKNDMLAGSKVKSFYSLKNAAGDAFKDRFTVKPKEVSGQRIPQSSTYTINLEGTDCEEVYKKIEFTSPNYPVGMLNWVAENNQKDLRENALILYFKKATETQKIAAFKKLEKIVKNEYKNRFKFDGNNKGVSYALDLDGMTPEELNGYKSFSLKLTKPEINKEIFTEKLLTLFDHKHKDNGVASADALREKHENGVIGDLARADYRIDGEKYYVNNKNLEGSFDEYKAKLNELGANDYQIDTLMGLCYQASFAELMESYKRSGCVVSGSKEFYYNVYKDTDKKIYFKSAYTADIYGVDESGKYMDKGHEEITLELIKNEGAIKYEHLSMTLLINDDDSFGRERLELVDVSALIKADLE